MAAASYNPGRPTAARKIGENVFAIDSFTTEASYLVFPEEGRCTCPDHCRRNRECKHLRAIAAQRPFIEAKAKAERCSDEQLARLLVKYAADPVISGALRVVRQERRAAARPAVGTATKVYGPATEAEAAQWLQAA